MKKLLFLAAAAIVALTFNSCSKDDSNGPEKYGYCTFDLTLKYKPDMTKSNTTAVPSGTTVKATIAKTEFNPARTKDYVEYYKVGKDGKVTVTVKAPHIYTDMKEFNVKLEADAIIYDIVKNAAGDKRAYKFSWSKTGVKAIAGEKFNLGEYEMAGVEYNAPGKI